MTDAATKARNTAQHCEAKKHALRQTQDGIVVAFVLHPNDVPPSLQLAPLGTRYMLALVEIGDGEQPKGVMPHSKPQLSSGATARNDTSPASEADNAPVRAKFSDKLYANQAGILCNDVKFRRFLAEQDQHPGIAVYDLKSAEDRVREICGVQSRTEIRPGTEAEQRWLLMVSGYRAWDRAPGCGVT